MRIPFLVFASVLVLQLVSAWDCSRDCPGYEDCINGVRRKLPSALERPPDMSLLEDGMFWEYEPQPKVAHHHQRSNMNRLRGSAFNNDNNAHRQLQSNYTRFQLKMFWAEGYCWQAENFEREWCMECSNCKKWGSDNECIETGGSSECNEDDYIWTRKCDKNEDEQQFVYEPVPEYGGGRLKPFHDQDLCWTRTRVNAHRLKKCASLSNIDTKQIIIGFQESGRFELHPYGWDEIATADNVTFPDGPKCLNNHHHPKEDEVVRAEFCRNSRRYKISRWIVINPVVVQGQSSGGGGAQGGGDGAPPVQPEGGSYCTPSSPCPQCYGDCDDDADCQGDLVCFERDAGDAVPSCSGGEDSDSDTDYCIDPNWSTASGVTPPPSPVPETPAPSPSPSSSPTASPSSPPPSASPSASPTASPTAEPTPGPTDVDLTASPSASPTDSPTAAPTSEETPAPTTKTPTVSPAPTAAPADEPTNPPTAEPTAPLTASPSASPTDEPTVSPTENPTAAPTPGPTASPTSSPSAAPTNPPSAPTSTPPPVAGTLPEVVVVNGTYCQPDNPCEECWGDCDEDVDCQGDLVCYQRDAFQKVPGCSGGEESNSYSDYCVRPEAIDSDGRDDTTTPSPVATSVTPAPATSPGIGADTGTLPVLSYPGCSPTSPCEKCQGDCDGPEDCAGDLICPDRSGGDTVPGCAGTDLSRTDFCVDPADIPP